MRSIIILVVLLIFSYHNIISQGADCCNREAILYCDYEHPFRGSVSTEKVHEEFCSSLHPALIQLFTQDCFQIVMPVPFDPNENPDYEYKFEVKFEEITNYTGAPNPRLTLKLSFDKGSFWDIVYVWEVEETGKDTEEGTSSWPLLLPKLLDEIRKGPDIIKIVEEYERRPINLEIGSDKDVLDPGEEIDVFLTQFKDKHGEPSQWFNRVIVHADSGEIINGAVCDIGPNYYAFQVENDFIKIKYKAPDDCNKSTARLTIYNSCDVLPQNRLFLNLTQLKDPINDKEFSINCDDATITVKKKSVKKNVFNKEEHITQDACKKHSKHDRKVDETIESTIQVSLKLKEVAEMPVYNQRWEYYEPTDIKISNFSLYSNDLRVVYGNFTGVKCAEGGYKTTTHTRKLLKDKKIEGIKNATWIVVFDIETDKALKIVPGGYDLSYEFDEIRDLKSVRWTDDGTSEDSSSETKTRKSSFAVGPVEDPKPDPTAKTSDQWLADYIKKNIGDLPPEIAAQIPKTDPKETQMEINPDVIVQFGDGKKYFGGKGYKLTTKKVDFGFNQLEESYTWQMTGRRKK